MDKIMHHIPSGGSFILEDEFDRLFIQAQGNAQVKVEQEIIHLPIRNPYLRPQPSTWKLVGEYSGIRSLVGVPTNVVLRATTQGSGMAFVTHNDPTYQGGHLTPLRPSYEVIGQSTFKGDESWTSSPFPLNNCKTGKITIQVTNAWRCDRPNGYGTVYLETSDDQTTWDMLEHFGLVEGMMTISQRGLKSGATFTDEFYITNPGTYGRIVYDPRAILGPGFQASATVEVSKQSTLRS